MTKQMNDTTTDLVESRNRDKKTVERIHRNVNARFDEGDFEQATEEAQYLIECIGFARESQERLTAHLVENYRTRCHGYMPATPVDVCVECGQAVDESGIATYGCGYSSLPECPTCHYRECDLSC